MEDIEDEWEDDCLMVVELIGIIDDDWTATQKCKIIGLESEQPLLQLDRYVFSGEYKDCVGTSVLFEKQITETEDEEEVHLKYKCHTFKKLVMKRAFLTEKEEKEATRGSSGDLGSGDAGAETSTERNDLNDGNVATEMEIHSSVS